MCCLYVIRWGHHNPFAHIHFIKVCEMMDGDVNHLWVSDPHAGDPPKGVMLLHTYRQIAFIRGSVYSSMGTMRIGNMLPFGVSYYFAFTWDLNDGWHPWTWWCGTILFVRFVTWELAIRWVRPQAYIRPTSSPLTNEPINLFLFLFNS